MSHSADTLLMRLHPSHLKKHRKSKKSNRSESDSGVIMDGRGHVSDYTSSGQSESGKDVDSYNINVYNFSEKGGKGKCKPVNPYSCVDIVEKIESTSEQLIRKLSQSETDMGNKCKGSTLSLPVCKLTPTAAHVLDSRAKSADNNLDYDHRRLSCTKEAKEYESSDIYSEDGAMDTEQESSNHSNNVENNSVFYSSAVLNKNDKSAISDSGDSVVSRSEGSVRSRSNGSVGSRSADSEESRSLDSNDSKKGSKINSYIRIGNKKKKDENKPLQDCLKSCVCGCHRNTFMPVVVTNGYVTQDPMVNYKEEQCSCKHSVEAFSEKTYYSTGNGFQDEESLKLLLFKDHLQNGCRPSSQVYNLPAHFFGSMSSMPVDPSRTTEL